MADIFSDSYSKTFGGSPDSDPFSLLKGMESYKQMQLINAAKAMENSLYGDKTQSEIDYKQAFIDEARQRMRKSDWEMREGAQMKYADKLAKQKEQDRVSSYAKVIPKLRKIREDLASGVDPTSIFTNFQKELPDLPSDMQGFFGTPEAMSLSEPLLKSAEDYARAQHPELNKFAREELKQTGSTSRNEASIASREKIASLTNELKRELEQMKLEGKLNTLSESQVTGHLLSRVANGTITPEELRALDVKQILNAAKTATPGVAPAIGSSGNITIENTQKKPSDVMNEAAIKAAVEAAGQTYDTSKFEYRIGPNGKLQSRKK